MTFSDILNAIGGVILFFGILFSPFAIGYVFVKIMEGLGWLD